MRLVQRVVLEKRASIIPIAVAIVANLAVYLIVVRPMQARAASGETRMLAATRAERDAERQLAVVRATQTGKQATESQLQTFYGRVLPAGLAQARQAAFVRLSQLAAESNVRYEHATADARTDRKSDLTQLVLSMSLAGSYQDVRRFLHAVETSPEFLIIDGMGLSMGDEPSAPLRLTLTVSTYFRNARNAT